MACKSPQLIFATFLMLGAFVETCYGDFPFNFFEDNNDLEMNFYREECPSYEYLIRKITTQRVRENPSLAAKLLRLHFHDCFVRGCDASVLLESPKKQAEKDAIPNQSLGGFDVITEIKTEIEKRCPQVVSCADIVTLAARDAVSALRHDAWWPVKTGRRDGKVSSASEALANLPSPFSDFETLKNNFSSKGLGIRDLVALSGAHTIGITHCIATFNRLYNFNGKNATDPSLDSTYAAELKKACPLSGNAFTEVDMDPKSAENFDSNYFKIVKQNKGIFQSDAALLNNGFSRALVNMMQRESKFFSEFGRSMQRMASIGVLTGSLGEIRRNCSVVN